MSNSLLSALSFGEKREDAGHHCCWLGGRWFVGSQSL